MTKDELCLRQELKAERHRAEAWKRSAAAAESKLRTCRELLEESNDD